MTHRTIALLITFALGFLVVPLAADAQQPGKIPRVGWLAAGFPGGDLQLSSYDVFLQGLRDLGYVEGQSLAMEPRWAEGQPDRLPALAAELVQLPVDVLVTFLGAAPHAAKKATTTVPIVTIYAADPVGTGLVASLARPGGNITGLSGLATDLSGKRLELLKEALPSLARVAVLWNARSAGMTRSFEQIQAAARALGVTVQPLGVHNAADFDSAFAAMTEERPDALFMITDVLTDPLSRRLTDFAAKSQLPTMFEFRAHVANGGLMSYGPSHTEQSRRAAYYVDRLLKGAKPADLPVEQPMTLELVINLKTAKALSLMIPPTLLFQATEVLR
jgi:putative ABC transport system substrate-binding protein